MHRAIVKFGIDEIELHSLYQHIQNITPLIAEINKAYYQQPKMAIETGHMLTTNNRTTINHRNKQGVMQTTKYSNKYQKSSHYKRGSRKQIMGFLICDGLAPSSWSPSMRSDLAAEDPKEASQNVSFRNYKRCSMAMKDGKLFITSHRRSAAGPSMRSTVVEPEGLGWET